MSEITKEIDCKERKFFYNYLKYDLKKKYLDDCQEIDRIFQQYPK